MRYPYLPPLLVMSMASVLVACSSSMSTGGGAQNYPQRPVQVTVNYPAGGSTDTVGRAIVKSVNSSDTIQERLQVVNREGGGGTVGVNEVVTANPNGYQLGFTTSGAVTIQFSLSDPPFRPDDINMLKQVAVNRTAVVVQADSGIQSLPELLADAKERTGEVGMGEGPPSYHFATSKLEDHTGAKFNRVDFGGDAPLSKALLGGEVEAITIGTGAVLPYVKADKMRVLAVLGEERSQLLPDVPTAKEEGVDVTSSVYFWLYGPTGLPEHVTDTVTEAFDQAAKSESFRSAAKETGVEVSIGSGKTSEETAKRIREEAQKVLD